MFRLARNISRMSLHHYKVGAVIVKHGKPISTGCNQIKTHPLGWFNGLHAEMCAINNADTNDFRRMSIFVYRENRKGEISNARPCNKCLKVLKDRGFKWMWYTIDTYPYFEVERL
jgi:cytidine deaminase